MQFIPFSASVGVVVRVLSSSAVDRGFEPRSGQTKDYKIGDPIDNPAIN